MALPKKHYENEKRLAAIALLHQITNIYVGFYGSNGFGQIENTLVASSDPHFRLEKVLIRVWHKKGAVFNYHSKEWEESDWEEKDLPLDEFLTHHVDFALMDTGVDWYNDVGGSGFWEWDPQNSLEFIIQVRDPEVISVRIEARELGSPMSEPEWRSKPIW